VSSACEFTHKQLPASNGRVDAVLSVLADEDVHQGRVSFWVYRIKVSLAFDRSVTPW
jgi:hypothetical protein